MNASCLIDNFGRGGFITYKLANTISGVEKFKKVPAGYNTPLFLTVQVSPKPSRGRPGDTDPRINLAVQNALLETIPRKVLKVNRAKVFVIVNALKEIYKRMRIGGSQAWWDSRHITNSIPGTYALELTLFYLILILCRNGVRGAKGLHTPETCLANPFPRISNADSEICTENVSTTRKFRASPVAGTVELISK